MANKLKNLKITSVDFVDEGANQQADIMLAKKKENNETLVEEQNLFERFFNYFKKNYTLVEEKEPQQKESEVAKNMEHGNTNTTVEGTPNKLEEVTKALAEREEANKALQAELEALKKFKEEAQKNDVNKALKAEIEELKKFKAAAEEREMESIAKSYEAVGNDTMLDDLKFMKAKGADVYEKYIKVLDIAKANAENGALFTEIGKSGHISNGNDTVDKIEGIAKSYMEKDNTLSYSDAVAKAWSNNPELFNEYNNGY